MTEISVIPKEEIKSKIYMVRGVQVILDSDLAFLYRESTTRLNEQVKRNMKRFPEKNMFQLTEDEWKSLRSQTATLNKNGRGKHRKYLPRVFTELGVFAVSHVLNNDFAIEVSQKIIEVLVELRHQITTNPEYALLLEKITHIESRMDTIELNQRIDSKMQDDKIITMSHDVKTVTGLFNEFKASHVTVKRPEEGEGWG